MQTKLQSKISIHRLDSRQTPTSVLRPPARTTFQTRRNHELSYSVLMELQRRFDTESRLLLNNYEIAERFS